jgi:ZIP family zinc transporter
LATFRRQGVPRRKRLLLTASLAVPVLAGAVLSFGLMRGRPTVVVEEIVPEAHREKDARLAALALVGGFALFTLLSIYLG